MLSDVRNESFAERFARLRDERALTQLALAGPAYTVSYVSQIESGRRSPSAKALMYFAERLGVSPSYLETGIPDGLEDQLAYRVEEARELCRTGEAEAAFRLGCEVLEQSETHGLTRCRGAALTVSADSLIALGRTREAIDRYEAALEDGLSDREQGIVVAALAAAYRSVGDLSYAADLIESKLKEMHPGPLDPSVSAELHSILVSIYFERGDITRAQRVAEQALAAAAEGASARGRANVLWSASRVAAEAKRWEEALALAREARVIIDSLNDHFRLARVHTASAYVCLEVDPPRLDEAEGHLHQAETILARGGPPHELAYVYAEQARLALLSDDPPAALGHAERALTNAGGDPLQRAGCLYLRGRALSELRRTGEAIEGFREAATIFEKVGARQQEASCYREIGEIELETGNLEAAVEEFRAGLEALEPRRSRA